MKFEPYTLCNNNGPSLGFARAEVPGIDGLTPSRDALEIIGHTRRPRSRRPVKNFQQEYNQYALTRTRSGSVPSQNGSTTIIELTNRNKNLNSLSKTEVRLHRGALHKPYDGHPPQSPGTQPQQLATPMPKVRRIKEIMLTTPSPRTNPLAMIISLIPPFSRPPTLR